jgi:16S rRNA C967 or C1407 C5-methylase (RsmB/RsmF family)/NOL1/NOP2/fmu family ribosome biogenesis protein
MTVLPEQFQRFMQEKLGGEFVAFTSSLQQPPPVSVRLNPGKKFSLATEKLVQWSAFGRYLNTRPSFTLDPHFHGGCYYVQEASSMFLEQALKQTLDLTKPLTMLDLSAAPGGKSTHMLSLISEKSLLVSNEAIRSRAHILNENIQKWGHANCIVTNNDPEHFQSLSAFFDAIVVDAPCSGEGLFRKDSAAMSEWSPDNVALCAARQKRIISDVWPALKENGLVIYCTCTFNEKENEDNLVWLQQEHEVEFLQLKLENEWGVEETRKGNAIGYRFYPHRAAGEGFFLSVMRKKEVVHQTRPRSKKQLTTASKKIIDSVRTWINEPETFEFFQHNDFIYILPKEKVSEVNTIAQHLNIINAGTTLSSVKHDKFIPEQAHALSLTMNKENFRTIDLSYDDAVKYLRKDTMSTPDLPKGFYLVSFEDTPLGWINHLGNRFNNLYPQEWRIRMSPQ